ncbi:Transcriptional regulator (GntR family) [Lachnospiraceae bacterium TWA4]|nr:Transcriptional regulator (GntR family) [Lachnospiraceae bacterium TWA4]
MQIFNYNDKRPIYEQIVDYFKTLILKGVYTPDEQLPSVRSLAVENSINPNTIQKAYAELERQKFIYSVKGRGSFVAPVEVLLTNRREEMIEEIRKLIKDASMLGISSDEFIKLVEQILTEVKEDDRS